MLPLVELSDENSIKRKQRAIAHLDYTTRLRGLLNDYAGQPDRPRFIVCVDELDKLPTTELLVDAVNDLKELFHVQGVHFVVSVSIDALRSFERRGLPNRDAFDSSFDTVIEVGRLTLEESVDIIVSRAAQFPPVLAYYCHAWSGGLPRDLLRVARRCVEIHTEGEPVATAAMIERIVQTDLRQLIDGLLETLEHEADGSLAWSMRERLTAETHPPDVVGFRRQYPVSEHTRQPTAQRGCHEVLCWPVSGGDGPSTDVGSRNVARRRVITMVRDARRASSTSAEWRLQNLALSECAKALPL